MFSYIFTIKDARKTKPKVREFIVKFRQYITKIMQFFFDYYASLIFTVFLRISFYSKTI